MRKVLLLVTALAACARGEDNRSDTVAAAPAAPANLTAADVRGSWTGSTRAADSDSVLARWTVHNRTDTTGVLLYEGSRDSVAFVSRFRGDSMILESSAYPHPTIRGRPRVKFTSVGRLSDGRLAGTVTLMLADRPDSVLSRGRWEATRQP